MSKSHVSMEQKVCIATGKQFDSGAILLDKRLRESMEMHTLTGWGVSPEVQEQIDKGFTCLVGIDPDKSEVMENGNIKPDGAYRTGDIAYVKNEAFEDMFNQKPPKEIIFAETELIEQLKKMSDGKN